MPAPETHFAANEAETRLLGASLRARLVPGDIVFLDGPLGAGKTTLVRGYLESLGYDEPVRSPTFNLIQVFETQPPVMHADLFRVASYQGIGLEEYLDSHVCLIEWPDRAAGLVDPASVWQIHIDFSDAGRTVVIATPTASSAL